MEHTKLQNKRGDLKRSPLKNPSNRQSNKNILKKGWITNELYRN